MAFPTPSEATLANLIHDLRQPLSNIETSVWCLASLTGSADPRIREQLALLERQLDAAECLLASAAAALTRDRVQRAAATASREITNSAS